MTTEQSVRTKKALSHLNNIKPYDGWSIDSYLNSSNKHLVMLKRRNVPLSNEGFVELALENETGCVVGIVSHIGETSNCAYARGVALVQKNGKPLHGAKEKRFTIDKNIHPSENEQSRLEEVRMEMTHNKKRAKDSICNRDSKERNETSSNHSSSNRSTVSDGSSLTDEQNIQLMKLGMIVISILTLLRILSNLISSHFVLVIAFGICYAMTTCPNRDTFDAKKELKRVLRGEYVPEKQQEKPKNWFSETLTRVQASVTAELATGLGYEVSFIELMGICTFVTVDVPSMQLKLYFLGIFDRWRYILHMNSKPSHRD